MLEGANRKAMAHRSACSKTLYEQMAQHPLLRHHVEQTTPATAWGRIAR
jgi:hypothetical protein